MSRSLRRLLRHGAPGEELVVSTRPRAGRLVRSFAVLLVVVVLAGVALGWLARDHADPVVALMRPTLVIGTVVVAVVVLGALAVRPYLRWYRTRYILTSARIIRRDGGLGSPVTEIWLAAVLHVHIAQRLGQRMSGSGDLVVDSPAGRLVFRDAPQVRRFAAVVSDAVGRVRAYPPGRSNPQGGHRAGVPMPAPGVPASWVPTTLVGGAGHGR